MIKFINGNLLENPTSALVNTVNTFGVMGKGVALQFKKAFPRNYETYRKACMNKQLHIGGLLAVADHNLLSGNKLIINFPTKTHWRFPSEYIYIEKGLVALRDYITQNCIKSLAMPAPGCGNGGLNWPVVKALIEQHLSGLDCHIEVYEP
jgi:O-acetyl-ADP-ribose deacetylase (regulator of RNase III)